MGVICRTCDNESQAYSQCSHVKLHSPSLATSQKKRVLHPSKFNSRPPKQEMIVFQSHHFSRGYIGPCKHFKFPRWALCIGMETRSTASAPWWQESNRLNGWMGFGVKSLHKFNFKWIAKSCMQRYHPILQDMIVYQLLVFFSPVYTRILGEFQDFQVNQWDFRFWGEEAEWTGHCGHFTDHLRASFAASLPCWSSSMLDVVIDVHWNWASARPSGKGSVIDTRFVPFCFLFFCNAAVHRKYLPMAGSVVEAKVSFWLFLKWFLLVRVQKASICMI